MSTLSIAMAQINPLVGDIQGNTQKVIQWAEKEAHADIVVFPELTLTGYPPEDLLLRPSLVHRIDQAITEIQAKLRDIAVVIGYPRYREERLYNMAGVFADGRCLVEYAKQCLPNYKVFDEKRYFSEGTESACFSWKNCKIALSICEDIWDGGPIEQARQIGADIILNLNASPYHRNKQAEREALVSQRAKSVALPIISVNQVGGQDELVFDGGSMAYNAHGELCARAPAFSECSHIVELELDSGRSDLRPQTVSPQPSDLESVYQALVTGVRDYVNKNRFKGVVLGLSGGIDSALTLAVAVDALGADRVEAVMMPFRYTSQMSLDDAEQQARSLNVVYRSLNIEGIYHEFMIALEDVFANSIKDKTEENIQARSRGVLLMAISNKKGYLVLTTGNKSEMAVGYATLYGDMAGGFDVLKDVPKTLVFELAKYRNQIAPVIPERVITRPPSAELAPDQKDEDSLPPYEVLDQILERYIEEDQSADDIIHAGFDAEQVHRVLRMVDLNEYKRRQAPIGVRITQRGFGRDRRYPITNGWELGN